MARLFWGKFPIEGAVALFFYEPHSEACNPIYDLKYHGCTEVGNELGSLLAHYCTEHGCLTGVDAIVPVPLTRRRQRHRGYNQSMEIARGISQLTGLPIYNKVLRRTVFKGSQTQKDAWQRMQNVEDAFLLTDAAAVRGKHLLLVDDVVTTGATVSACARQLCLAGDVRISILSLGFVRH
jgi:ComF family protein